MNEYSYILNNSLKKKTNSYLHVINTQIKHNW